MNRYKQSILENLIYVIIWFAVVSIPIFSFRDNNGVNWDEAYFYLIHILPFFILFLLNNYLLIPHFLLRKRLWAYFALVSATIIMLFFLWFRLVAEPVIKNRMHDEPKTEVSHHDPPLNEPCPPPHTNRPDAVKNPRPSKEVPPGGPVIRMPVRMAPMLNDWILALLIVGFNVAIRFMFKSIRDDRQIKELESHTLQSELNYLKTQINPHFFMNTLNNIHALVDIDTEKAKQTVIELSRIMRYVLYEADRSLVPLVKEVQFLDNYVELMRIRFTDEVDITTAFPNPISDVKIPPLLLVTLLENAFKHGISYRNGSFIHTTLTVESLHLTYRVSNSNFATGQDKPGVGMENMRKRLDLLFGNNYSLEVINSKDSYDVLLTIPVEE